MRLVRESVEVVGVWSSMAVSLLSRLEAANEGPPRPESMSPSYSPSGEQAPYHWLTVASGEKAVQADCVQFLSLSRMGRRRPLCVNRKAILRPRQSVDEACVVLLFVPSLVHCGVVGKPNADEIMATKGAACGAGPEVRHDCVRGRANDVPAVVEDVTSRKRCGTEPLDAFFAAGTWQRAFPFPSLRPDPLTPSARRSTIGVMKPHATPSPEADDRLGRRELLQRGALVGLAMTAAPLGARAHAAQKAGHVQRYAVLGRTGLKVSDISFGGSMLGAGEGDIVRHALDHGINYFDTAESYRGGESETTIGEALRG